MKNKAICAIVCLMGGLCLLTRAIAQVTPLIIPQQREDGLLAVEDWRQIVRNRDLPKFNVVGSEALNTQWPGNVVILFADANRVTLPWSPGAVGRYRLSLGVVCGDNLGNVDILLNGQHVGYVEAGGDEAVPKVVTMTPDQTAWAHGNTIELVRKTPGSIGVMYIASEPGQWVDVPMDVWQHDPGTGNLVTYFHNPVPFSRPIWQLQSDAPCTLSVNGKVLLESNGNTVTVRLPYGLFGMVNEVVLTAADAQKPPVFKLKTSPFGGARFMSSLPQSLDAGKQINDWPRVMLTNGALSAVVALPDNHKGFYRGPRFEQAGMVTSLQFAGHEFVSQNQAAARNPIAMDHVCGPAGEFDQPLGYDNAPVGTGFVKLGVGLLEKPQANEYFFGSLYYQLQPFAWETNVSENAIVFHQTVNTPMGYAYDYTKTLALPIGQQSLVITHVLRNTGSRRIETSHYSHNFFLLDHLPPSPDYRLSFGYVPQFKTGNVSSALRKITPESFTLVSGRTFFSNLAGCLQASDAWCQWEHLPTGLTFRMTDSHAPIHQALYMCSEGICPESFVRIALEPGKSMQWQRTYSVQQSVSAKDR